MMDINPSRPDAQQTGERPMNLSDFAQRNQITEDRVWELIEEGELAARFVNDEILILREQDTDDDPEIDLPGISEVSPREAAEPSLENWHEPKAEPLEIRVDGPASHKPAEARRKADTPEFSKVAELLRSMEGIELATGASVREKTGPSLRTEPAAGAAEGKSPGIYVDRDARNYVNPAPDFFAEPDAAAQDEDSLPTDDYRDLLVFAQDAMTRTMELSRQLLATKDELIRMKVERIQQLMSEQQKQELEIRRLRKKVEDLETLCRLTPNP